MCCVCDVCACNCVKGALTACAAGTGRRNKTATKRTRIYTIYDVLGLKYIHTIYEERELEVLARYRVKRCLLFSVVSCRVGFVPF